MFPLTLKNVKGFFLDRPTFQYTGFKLAIAKGCEYQLIEQRKLTDYYKNDRDSLVKQMRIKQDNFDFQVKFRDDIIKKQTDEIYKQDVQLKVNKANKLGNTFKGIGLVAIGFIAGWFVGVK